MTTDNDLTRALRDIAMPFARTVTPTTTFADMTAAELAAALDVRAAYLRRLCKVGSNIITVQAAYCIADDCAAAADMLRDEAQGDGNGR